MTVYCESCGCLMQETGYFFTDKIQFRCPECGMLVITDDIDIDMVLLNK